ncbi:sugar phosphate nucleotidyltransferase [Heyndrickxia ginsengihumi]|uniref:sugar phosphate nucleotidyltransferase n=1 Tax=Heyndrickxia ginsengihumi TaxID=363870 RepID=UPI003D23F72A
MKLILLSGGSGKRLWPLSNEARSKQFLRILKNNNNVLESMVQRVWNQLKEANLHMSTSIATSKSQVEMIKSQINDEVDIIIEPSRRDTFPAIALAATYLHSVKNVCLNEIVAILPVDPYVEPSFFNKIKDLESAIQTTKSDLALMGVKPTYPSEKYGYILPKKNSKRQIEGLCEVESFIEKPDEELANSLIRNGALWNCGVFAFRLSYIIKLLEKMNYPTQYQNMIKIYDELPKKSFDYEIVEKTQNIIVIPYEGYWKDLGTWNTLTEEMGTNQIGEGIISDDCMNSHLINNLDIPVTMLGISNAVVVASPDGILVSDKEKSPKLKDLVKYHSERPMFVERKWGWYRVLDYVKYESYEVLTKRIRIKEGCNLSYHYHIDRNETWTVIKGTGLLVIDTEIKLIKPGDIIQIDRGVKHSIKSNTEIELIEVQSGPSISDNDIQRLSLNWEDIKRYSNSCNQGEKI